MTVGEAIRAAAEALAPESDTARLDAELLMAHLFGVTRSELLLRHMRDPSPPGFAALVERRAGHEPVAYITGRQEFYGLPFIVTPATLIPRGDSETLVAAALEAKPDAGRVLDLGTGSGALLLAVLAYLRQAHGVGIDRSPEAVAVAVRNAEQLGLRPQAMFREGDWLAPGWADDLGTFDLILCNPPYVESDAALDPQVRDFEPATALFAGPEGLDDYRVLIPQLRALMNPQALAVLEIGANQAEAVGALAAASGFATALRRDLAGRARALLLS
ncbi:peptide chain release factor N(5)-glutamine methyltransferase [Erythrobacter oryzae]|uniref:peptide chain release factor N(5)-glutamine methyltransferase n=1 Tax=Erythrobacter oryzae TaxID=3019556 RepID=UPI0025549436|nr:peptide chain release factor N(5)-glutamine methyltransferase [Erythrobacter sp. COR-2]